MIHPNGLFIQIDGIDGAGKSTLLQAALDWMQERQLKTFDSVAWSQKEGRLPRRQEDVGEADVLLTAEPTHAWIGKAIRDEIIRNGARYDAHLTAEAFALDRAVQHTCLTLPFLSSGENQIVIQDRGLLSSLAYQSLQSEMAGDTDPVTIPWLLSLAGNQLTLERPPDVFVFLDVAAEVAQTRLAGRTDKDDHRFERADFQIALAERYKRSDVRGPLEERGTRIVTIDGGKSKEEVAAAMRALLEELV